MSIKIKSVVFKQKSTLLRKNYLFFFKPHCVFYPSLSLISHAVFGKDKNYVISRNQIMLKAKHILEKFVKQIQQPIGNSTSETKFVFVFSCVILVQQSICKHICINRFHTIVFFFFFIIQTSWVAGFAIRITIKINYPIKINLTKPLLKCKPYTISFPSSPLVIGAPVIL